MRLIDLRSDTVTRPTPAMREAMARAEVGDDVYGEDPTVARLEERSADLLGKEAALFVPSGTMANQIALGVLARGGDEVVCEAGAHCFAFEGGALAALWGVQARTTLGERGVLDPVAVEAAIRPDDPHYPRTRAVAIENTHNRGGGKAWSLAAVRAVGDVAARRGLALYMVGARLLNAVVATGTSARDYAAPATLASMCFSKGLGAPVGSVLAGPRPLIQEGRRLRKRRGSETSSRSSPAPGSSFRSRRTSSSSPSRGAARPSCPAASARLACCATRRARAPSSCASSPTSTSRPPTSRRRRAGWRRWSAHSAHWSVPRAWGVGSGPGGCVLAWSDGHDHAPAHRTHRDVVLGHRVRIGAGGEDGVGAGGDLGTRPSPRPSPRSAGRGGNSGDLDVAPPHPSPLPRRGRGRKADLDLDAIHRRRAPRVRARRAVPPPGREPGAGEARRGGTGRPAHRRGPPPLR